MPPPPPPPLPRQLRSDLSVLSAALEAAKACDLSLEGRQLKASVEQLTDHLLVKQQQVRDVGG